MQRETVVSGINLESCQGRRSGERVLKCTLRFLVAPAFDDESPEQSLGPRIDAGVRLRERC